MSLAEDVEQTSGILSKILAHTMVLEDDYATIGDYANALTIIRDIILSTTRIRPSK